jgi:hypothetical protein
MIVLPILFKATGLEVARSSCSYAAVALARSRFRKGASFTPVIGLLLGWQFTLAEFVGGP